MSRFLSPFFFKIMNDKTKEMLLWVGGIVVVSAVMSGALLLPKPNTKKSPYNQNFLRAHGLAELDSRYIHKPRFLRFVDTYGVPWKGTICGWKEITGEENGIE